MITDHYVTEFLAEFNDAPSNEIALSLARHLVYEHNAATIYLRRERPLAELKTVHVKAHKEVKS